MKAWHWIMMKYHEISSDSAVDEYKQLHHMNEFFKYKRLYESR